MTRTLVAAPAVAPARPLAAPRDLRTGRLRATLDGLGRIDLRFRRTGAIHETANFESVGPQRVPATDDASMEGA